MRKNLKIAPNDEAVRLALAALRKCARPDCNESFIRRFERHRFCSSTCKATVWKRAHRKVS